MSFKNSILLLEDEPLVLMDLEFAGQDHGCTVYAATSCEEALAALSANDDVAVAILDVNLGGGHTSVPVARELRSRGIPFVLHSGDLDRHDEHVRNLDAPLIAKPAPSDEVIAAAIALLKTHRPYTGGHVLPRRFAD